MFPGQQQPPILRSPHIGSFDVNAPLILRLPHIDSFDVNAAITYMLVHKWPGGWQPVMGIAMNLAFEFEVCPDSGVWCRSTIIFVSIVCCPHYYEEEVIDQWDLQHSNESYVSLMTGYEVPSPLQLCCMEIHDVYINNISEADMVAVLVRNGIPVLWMNYAYQYAFYYLQQHLVGDKGTMLDKMAAWNEDPLEQLKVHKVPPAIPEWDEWCNPLSDKLGDIQAQIAREKGSVVDKKRKQL